MRNGTRAALLFFVLGFCTCLCMLTMVRSLRKVDVNWPLEKPKAFVKAVFYPVGECPECKKISRQYWKVDKLNDDNDIQLEAARRMGHTPFATNAEFEQKKDLLVSSMVFAEVKDCDLYTVKKLTHSYPYLVPRALVLLNEIGTRFEAKLERLEIAPFKMQISSVLRTIEGQDGLGKHNTNAAPISSHMYGTTFDISYKEFLQQSGEPAKEGFCRHDLMRHVLAEVLTEMRAEGRCKVVIERHQACFHITVAN
jgi:hypothetical protein